MADPAPNTVAATLVTKGGNSDVWIVRDELGQAWCLQCSLPGRGLATVTCNRAGLVDHLIGDHVGLAQRVPQAARNAAATFPSF